MEWVHCATKTIKVLALREKIYHWWAERQKGLIKEYDILSFLGLINACLDLVKKLQIYAQDNK